LMSVSTSNGRAGVDRPGGGVDPARERRRPADHPLARRSLVDHR